VNITIVHGDLLDQAVDVIVNAWNRNIIPRWLLLPQGVSGAIKRQGGTGPFKELRKHGSILLGCAVFTSAGKLPFKGIIHVAGINMLWRALPRSVWPTVRPTTLRSRCPRRERCTSSTIRMTLILPTGVTD
jgi:O-acetyl-ADP-ribose deacetylase (regulator of RNase III)